MVRSYSSGHRQPGEPTGSGRRGQASVGCSGWDYPDWRGVVYPERLARRCWFDHYATLFDTVELNATFYRLPERSTVDAWREQAPAGFTYAFKLGQYGSHRKKLGDPEDWLVNHLDRATRLGPSLGVTLVQLPPRWRKNTDRLGRFLDAVPAGQRWAFEFRDPSWLVDDVFATLRDHGAALCLHDLLPDHPVELTTDWTYVRFHGPRAIEEPYRGRYTGRRLRHRADRMAEWLGAGIDVHAYFNNDYDGHAVADARWLRERLAGRQPIRARASG